MLKRFYEECNKNFIEFEKIIKKCYETIILKADYNFLGDFQKAIISYGENLENEWALSNTAIITELENLCEILYKITISEANDDLLVQIKENIDRLPEAFASSCIRTDYGLSAVLIAKNEDRYIEEWIEYHRLVGVDHFYIFDNDSEESFRTILDPYIEKGIVTYIYFPGEKMQLSAYNYAIEHFKYDTQYMAFIDADEFIVAAKHNNILAAIDEIITNYINLPYRSDGKVGGIAVNWRMYGSSGNKCKFDGLLIDNLIYRAEDYNSENVLIKTICNPRHVVKFDKNPHTCVYQDGYICISERGSMITTSYFADGSGELLRINHYYLKSEEEYIEKCSRGWPDRYNGELLETEARDKFRAMDKSFNVIKDDIMEPYVSMVKKAIESGV